MQAEELQKLLTSPGRAADVLEAIDDPALQKLHGWNLADWSYEPIPWGVAFWNENPRRRFAIAVVVAPATSSTELQKLSEKYGLCLAF